MLVLDTSGAVRAWAAERRRLGERIALVPTMGFLHEGHLSLMREGARRADAVAVSIFVNQSQFGPKEDLARYPRDFDGDVAKCESVGVAMIYAPQPSAVYPPGYQTWVNVENVSQGMDGDRRPGHFRGVATVVTKLLSLVQPDAALFGEKDYQQLQVISALARDLDLGVEIIGMPTQRERDGLAMSSRNSYLSAGDRSRAVAVSRGLLGAQAAARAGEGDASKLIALARQPLAAADIKEDYLELRHAVTLATLSQLERGVPARMLVAAFVGSTRLIDNVSVALG